MKDDQLTHTLFIERVLPIRLGNKLKSATIDDNEQWKWNQFFFLFFLISTHSLIILFTSELSLFFLFLLLSIPVHNITSLKNKKQIQKPKSSFCWFVLCVCVCVFSSCDKTKITFSYSNSRRKEKLNKQISFVFIRSFLVIQKER